MTLSDRPSDLASTEYINSPASYPEVTQQLSENVILTTLDAVYTWARLSSLWPLFTGLPAALFSLQRSLVLGLTSIALG